MSVPEKPPIELPKPFFAHTLFAPSIPGQLPPKLEELDDPPAQPELPRKWYQRFLLPPRREPPGYAQASERYLTLIREGARENELPEDYQAYLARLQPYTATTCRQKVGRLFFLVPFLIVGFCARLLSGSKGPRNPSKDGTLPPWVAALIVIHFNIVWMAYDFIMKPLFGDGEHTLETGKGRRVSRNGWLGMRCSDEEKRGLLATDDEDEDEE